MALGAATELLPYDGSAILYLDVLTPAEAGDAFESLGDELEWQQNQIRIYGRSVPEPRLVCWIDDPHARYSYSGIQLSPAPWSRTVTSLRRVCEKVAGVGFNSVLVNLYRDGADSVAWHSDNEPELGIEPTIASLSLGTTRRFRRGDDGALPERLGTPDSQDQTGQPVTAAAVSSADTWQPSFLRVPLT